MKPMDAPADFESPELPCVPPAREYDRCLRCNRKLHSTLSRRLGLGRTCASEAGLDHGGGKVLFVVAEAVRESLANISAGGSHRVK